MAISPNDTFLAGQVLTAQECNNFPRGVMATASSTANYTLTTSAVIATGMTVTFTAVTGRNYRITYFEPEAQTPNIAGSSTASIKITNAAGTRLTLGKVSTVSTLMTGTLTVVYVGTLTAGSITIVGTAETSSTSGAPSFVRSATSPAQITVEDIGTA